MPLHEHFESSGNWLFQRRSHLPFLLLVPVAAAVVQFQYPGGSERLHNLWAAACAAVSLVGLAVRMYTVGHTPKKTSGRNTKEQVADTINTTGIYSVVRHPLYLGNYLVWLGFVMFWCSAWLVLAFSLMFWLYYERIMFAEEEFLRGRHGEQFVAWASRTPAFLPNFRLWQRPQLPFSLRNALKREHNCMLGIAVAFVLMEVVTELLLERHFALEPAWIVFGAAGLTIALVLRTLKRHTRLLHVSGR